MERPSQFQGKTIDQVQQSELADIVRQRQQDATERAPGIGGAETGAGPVHWYEYYGAKNSRPWLIVDPADGRIPSLTPEAQQRAAALTGGSAAGAASPIHRKTAASTIAASRGACPVR